MQSKTSNNIKNCILSNIKYLYIVPPVHRTNKIHIKLENPPIIHGSVRVDFRKRFQVSSGTDSPLSCTLVFYQLHSGRLHLLNVNIPKWKTMETFSVGSVEHNFTRAVVREASTYRRATNSFAHNLFVQL